MIFRAAASRLYSTVYINYNSFDLNVADLFRLLERVYEKSNTFKSNLSDFS
nr:protein [Spodoptera litura nucleopolyhedrovirus]